jgi:hypothetical protein
VFGSLGPNGDALRALILAEAMSTFGLVADFSILLATGAIMVIIGGKLYPGGNMIFSKSCSKCLPGDHFHVRIKNFHRILSSEGKDS